MKKETIIAIVLGIGAGIGIALFVIQGTRNNNSGDEVILDEHITPTVSISTTASEPLLISEPENNMVTDQSTLEIKGRVQEGSLIVVQTPQAEEVLRNEQNDFSFEVNLLPGENNIMITSYTDKMVDTRSITIYHIVQE